MKQVIILSAVICALASLCGEVKAENTDISEMRHVIYIDPVTVPQGTTEYTLSVKMNNQYEAQGFNFGITLPEGFNFAMNNGSPDVTLSTERTSKEHLDRFDPEILSDGSLNVVAYGYNKDGKITGNEGEIVRVHILLPENAGVGDYTIEVKNFAINLTTGDDAITEDYGEPIVVKTTLTIEEAAVTRICFDENSNNADALTDATGVDVKVRRTIKANQWSTICLPFAMTEAQVKTAFGDDVQIADFTGCEATYDEAEENIIALKVNFEDVTAIEVNHPYIIKVSQPITEFTVDGVNIAPSNELSVDRDEDKYKRNGKWYYDYNSFIGTYVVDTEVPEQALFLSDNKFWYSMGNTKMKAFRGYFSFYQILSDVLGAEARITMSFNESETTAITENGRGKSLNGEKIYDMQGRRVKKPTKGLYINGSKKVVIK